MPNREKTLLSKKSFWLGLAALIILLDQLSKLAILQSFAYGERLNVLPVFDLTLVYNYGAAWSFLSDAGGWQRWFFTIISSVVSVVLLVWVIMLCKETKATKSLQVYLLFALSFILGGAIGNLIDRVAYGYVVDFLLVYYRDSHFPVFNLADSAITLGAGFMILDTVSPKTIELK